jgi:hypothetical protein
MAIDVSKFHRHNVADACAVWNVLSSLLFFSRAKENGVSFVCTRFVVYECLIKQRQKNTENDLILQSRLRQAQKQSDFAVYPLDVSDLQMVAILENRKKLGKGELSSIALAMKIRQAFLTDDQKARKLAAIVMDSPGAQTTPHLFGWLVFINAISDSEKQIVVDEHGRLGRPLKSHFEDTYLEALRCRLMLSTSTGR